MGRTSLNSKRDLAEELAQDPGILHCVKDDAYAHKLYSALCNTEWQPDDVMDILKDATWSSSWRSTGGIIAELRSCREDYMDWYCSGFEGYVHPDIRADLKRLGWVCTEEDDAEEFGGIPPENKWGKNRGISGAFSFHRFKDD